MRKLGIFLAGVALAASGWAAHAQDSGATPAAAPAPPPPPEDWSLHFQSTFIGQGYPAFPSTVEGPNSLPSHGDIRETFSATGFLGRRMPWDGGELYFNPELNQGFGLGHTLGVDGFVNGEAQKAGYDTPDPNVARLFLRQTFGLGGEQETLAPDLNQLGETVDVSRVTVTAGKFAAPDIFDNNRYAHDPRVDFFNWSLWEAGAWDYPADTKGYTGGLATELNEKDWALRGGWFLEPTIANQRDLDTRFWKHFGSVIELETRHDWLGEPGVLRYLVFANRAHMGSLQQAVDLAEETGTPADIAAVRADRWKVGFALNLEQSLTEDLGLFSRLSWNDGRTEAWAFTDIDRSFTLGLSLKGTSWGRSRDTIGLGGAVNGLSHEHQLFFANGGVGILAGDGSLDYAPEGIIETYYSYSVIEPVALTFDYQFVANPAFNQARGPVHVFALRAHVEF
ncbi:MAG TPA: carbohydrate porin [Stellaceae bacterium]|nr:carbohydrate porin [Stellaceae bacterium]